METQFLPADIPTAEEVRLRLVAEEAMYGDEFEAAYWAEYAAEGPHYCPEDNVWYPPGCG